MLEDHSSRWSAAASPGGMIAAFLTILSLILAVGSTLAILDIVQIVISETALAVILGVSAFLTLIFLYLLISYILIGYTLDAQGLKLAWGFWRVHIPYDEIEAVEAAGDVLGEQDMGWQLFWPGYYVGTRKTDVGDIRVVATLPPRRQLLIARSDGEIFAISPERPLLFTEELIRWHRMFHDAPAEAHPKPEPAPARDQVRDEPVEDAPAYAPPPRQDPRLRDRADQVPAARQPVPAQPSVARDVPVQPSAEVAAPLVAPAEPAPRPAPPASPPPRRREPEREPRPDPAPQPQRVVQPDRQVPVADRPERAAPPVPSFGYQPSGQPSAPSPAPPVRSEPPRAPQQRPDPSEQTVRSPEAQAAPPSPAQPVQSEPPQAPQRRPDASEQSIRSPEAQPEPPPAAQPVRAEPPQATERRPDTEEQPIHAAEAQPETSPAPESPIPPAPPVAPPPPGPVFGTSLPADQDPSGAQRFGAAVPDVAPVFGIPIEVELEPLPEPEIDPASEAPTAPYEVWFPDPPAETEQVDATVQEAIQKEQGLRTSIPFAAPKPVLEPAGRPRSEIIQPLTRVYRQHPDATSPAIRPMLHRDRFSMAVAGIGVLTTAAMIGYIGLQYDDIPPSLTLHWNVDGLPGRIGEPREIWILPVIAGLVLLANLGLAWSIAQFDRFAARLLVSSTLIVHAVTWLALIMLLN